MREISPGLGLGPPARASRRPRRRGSPCAGLAAAAPRSAVACVARSAVVREARIAVAGEGRCAPRSCVPAAPRNAATRWLWRPGAWT